MESSIRKQITGNVIVIPSNDIDTDRIIPARFMTGITFDGLGDHAFHDERFEASGKLKVHPFNDPVLAGHSLLLVGKNFGCGSSREHAPQALMRFGIKAIVGESFADIFAGNCATLGMPLVTISYDDSLAVASLLHANVKEIVVIDLVNCTVTISNKSIPLSLPESARSSFIAGTWDMTGVMLAQKEAIVSLANKLPYLNHFKNNEKAL